MSRYHSTIRRVTGSLGNYRFDEVAHTLYDFIWSEWCDWYLEMVKVRLNGPDEKTKSVAQAVLVEVLGAP